MKDQPGIGELKRKGVATRRWLATTAVAVAVAAISAAAAGDAGGPERSSDAALTALRAEHPQVAVTRDASGRIQRVFGEAFRHGPTAHATAESFRREAAALFNAEPQDLVPAEFEGRADHTLPVLFDADARRYRFTAVYYRQQRDGVDVFGSRLVLLTRNEPGHPLVLANGQLRDLGDVHIEPGARGRPISADVEQAVLVHANRIAELNDGPAQIVESRKVIFAGVDGVHVPPRLADEVIVQRGVERWRMVVDAQTGAMLHEQSLICRADLQGTSSGLATQGIGADLCELELSEPLPYLEVDVGGETYITAEDGAFMAPGLPSVPVSVSVLLRGTWFEVFNWAGDDLSVSTVATPPATIVLPFNASNVDPLQRAQVNAYLHANVVRDFVLQFNPAYPTLAARDFPIFVNRDDGFCPGNAWYDIFNPSLNFCQAGVTDSGQPRPNTAWSSIIYHEFGHHLVETAGSGQGQYGEGIGDCMSTILLDTPLLGFGFYNNCSDSLRTADNDIEVPCTNTIHYCGQALSGCIWDTRQELIQTNPNDYQDILANLTINSILLHTTSTIETDLVIDFLTLDDDNGNIFDGTPHFDAIAAGFSEHGMTIPALDPIGFEFPDGLPEYASPDGTTTFRVRVVPIDGTPQPGQAWMTYRIDGSEDTVALNPTGDPNLHIATLPAATCGQRIDYYFFAQSTDGVEIRSPYDAPENMFHSFAAFASAEVFADHGETSVGWQAEPLDASDGHWQRGEPVNDINWSHAPSYDSDGSGQCWLTGNKPGNSDVDDGSVRLTTPAMNLIGPPAIISYDWFLRLSNENGNDRMMVEMTDGDGTWTEVLRHDRDGGYAWNTQQITPQQMAASGIDPTADVRLRFTVSDLTPQSIVEAAIDNVRVELLACEKTGPVGDVNGDGAVNVYDLFELLSAWGDCAQPCPPSCPADLTGDCVVDVFDLFEVLSNWSG